MMSDVWRDYLLNEITAYDDSITISPIGLRQYYRCALG